MVCCGAETRKQASILLLSVCVDALGSLCLAWLQGEALGEFLLGDSTVDLAAAACMRLLIILIALVAYCIAGESVLLAGISVSDQGSGGEGVAELDSSSASVYSTTDARYSLPHISRPSRALNQPLLSGDAGSASSSSSSSSSSTGDVAKGGEDEQQQQQQQQQKQQQQQEAEEAKKALEAHVAARAVMVWCVYAAQLLLVGVKCLARVSVFQGSEGSDSEAFWGATAVAVLLPFLEARAGTALLWAALEKKTAGSASSGDGAPGDGGESKGRQARLGDMFALVLIDWHLMLLAVSGLTVAAAGESTIPYLYGQIIESITDSASQERFKTYMLWLVVVAAVTGLATGVRGSTFIVLGARFSTRLRQQLFDRLLILEVGFFDATKTGDVSSRLTADCQKVGDQVELNVNVFLRSVLQAALTVAFMYWLNWRLATLAFITVPNVVLASKVFGNFMRGLTKKVQKALAESTAAAEEALSSIRTVKT